MTQDLATINHSQLASLEKVVTEGDLKNLSTAERLRYYGDVCNSVGLNPLTRPFEYLVLNGKTILYARKDCTDQLRKLHGVSIRLAFREAIEGCYVVTASASLPNGRVDESTGVVPIPAQTGEARANALMKAETKAKRRATLSICGLGFLDESETESVPGAVRVDLDAQTPMPVSAAVPPANPDTGKAAFLKRAEELGFTKESQILSFLGLAVERGGLARAVAEGRTYADLAADLEAAVIEAANSAAEQGAPEPEMAFAGMEEARRDPIDARR